MKKKTSIVAGLILLFLIVYSCEQEDHPGLDPNSENGITDTSNDPLNILLFNQEKVDESDCNNTVKKDFFAGQNIRVGEIIIDQGTDYLRITYDLSSTDWRLKESHLYVGDINEAPFTNSGNPKLGNFPFQETHDLSNQYTYEIPLNTLNDCISVITHAEVIKVIDGNQTANETAFGFGNHSFEGNRWGWYVDFCIIDCEETDKINEDENSLESENESESEPDEALTNQNGCMDAFAYDKKHPGNSICFHEDFNHWGWSNYIGVNKAHSDPLGITYTYPVFASAFQCDITNSMEVGTLAIHISGGDGRPFANVALSLNHPDLIIESFHFYVGETAYPLDGQDQETTDTDHFTISLNSLDTTSYNINNIEWYDASYFISQIKVCPKP